MAKGNRAAALRANGPLKAVSTPAGGPGVAAAACHVGRPLYRSHGSRRRGRVVALTFDDGPSDYTPQMLDVLRRHHAVATFFVLGNQLRYSADHRHFVRVALRDGHAVGDHTYDHANLLGLSPTAARNDILWGRAFLQRASGFTPCIFRAPYGAKNDAIVRTAAAMGMNTVQWDVDPTDYARPGRVAIVNRVLNAVRPGSIVLMHDGGGFRDQSVAALPSIIEQLRHRGYRFRTVPQLLGLAGRAR